MNCFKIQRLIPCLLCLTFAVVASADSAFAAGPYYIRDGATGSSTITQCKDWSLQNACDVLPATLERGATYYVAGGFYPSYTFTTPESTSPTNLVVTVKKATIDEHGTTDGWSDTLATTQAEFDSFFNITRSFFTIDGSYREESNWFDGSKYGFKIQEKGNWQHMRIFDPSAQRSLSDVTVKNIYIKAIVGSLPPNPPAPLPNNHCYTNNGTPIGPCAINTNTESTTRRGTKFVFSKVFVEGSNNPFFLRNTIDPLLEYSASLNTAGSADWHGEVVNRYYSGEGTRGGGVIRFNHFRNSYNGASGFRSGGSTGVIVVSDTSGTEIYGNIFEDFEAGNGGIGAGWNNKNIKAYNNTFINGYTVIENANGTVGNAVQFPLSTNTASGNEAYNNLTFNMTNWRGDSGANYSGQGTAANNLNLTSSSIFVNPSAHNFRISQATSVKGRQLVPSLLDQQFNLDIDRKNRDLDAYWDVGAFEFNPTSGTAPSSPKNLRVN